MKGFKSTSVPESAGLAAKLSWTILYFKGWLASLLDVISGIRQLYNKQHVVYQQHKTLSSVLITEIRVCLILYIGFWLASKGQNPCWLLINFNSAFWRKKNSVNLWPLATPLAPGAPLTVSPQLGDTCCIPHGWQPDANLLPAIISCLVCPPPLQWYVRSLICHRLLRVCSHLTCKNTCAPCTAACASHARRVYQRVLIGRQLEGSVL